MEKRWAVARNLARSLRALHNSVRAIEGFFVGVDPVLHNPTRMFISFEFKEDQVAVILEEGWNCWEREKTTRGLDSPVETVVGGRSERFLDYIRFEQAALGLDQGHRHLLAEQVGMQRPGVFDSLLQPDSGKVIQERIDQHKLSREFELDSNQILSLIDSAPRLKVAVRGWVAESHLERELNRASLLNRVVRLEQDGQPDFRLELKIGLPIRLECKNVLRKPLADGTIKVDFQKTRASINNPCSRFYSTEDFQVLAACLHPATEKWEFRYQLTSRLQEHDKCRGKLDNKVRLSDEWYANIDDLLRVV